MNLLKFLKTCNFDEFKEWLSDKYIDNCANKFNDDENIKIMIINPSIKYKQLLKDDKEYSYAIPSTINTLIDFYLLIKQEANNVIFSDSDYLFIPVDDYKESEIKETGFTLKDNTKIFLFKNVQDIINTTSDELEVLRHLIT